MIYNITNTPYSQPVYFGCKQPKSMVCIVDNIFRALAASRKKSNLGLLLGKSGKTNYVVEEKIFGKNAKIYFKNDDLVQEIELSRAFHQPIKITPLSENLSLDCAQDLICENLGCLNYKA